MFDISADEYIFSKEQINKTSLCRQIDSILDTFGDKNLQLSNILPKQYVKQKSLKNRGVTPTVF